MRLTVGKADDNINLNSTVNVASFSVDVVEHTACSFKMLIKHGNKLAACSTWLIWPVTEKLVLICRDIMKMIFVWYCTILVQLRSKMGRLR